MKTILIYSVDPGFLEEMRSKIQELETDRLSEILLFLKRKNWSFMLPAAGKLRTSSSSIWTRRMTVSR